MSILHVGKCLIPAAGFLLLCGPLSFADLAGMSLQERMRRSDAVVVGEILESHDTGLVDESAGELWTATCRVEGYYIKGPKRHHPDPNVEEGKAVRLIKIAFLQKMAEPTPIKLMAGGKYLLFLKETGPNQYAMITDYHGAFEAGQDYFVHDEQSPEYPAAVKMSFEEIVLRVTPQDSASVDVRQQSDRELSEDELRMKERLTALSRGEGAVADLRVEVSDGSSMVASRSFAIADGKIVSQQWDAPGSGPKLNERAVTDEEIRQFLGALIERQYWTFKGTTFIPDAPGFMFRFHYNDLNPVAYRCDAHEYEPSERLSAIRSLWLGFVLEQSIRDPVLERTETDQQEGVDIRGQLDAATGYWYAFFRDKPRPAQCPH